MRMRLRELNLGCNKLTDASISLISGALLGVGCAEEGGGGGVGDHHEGADGGVAQGYERRHCNGGESGDGEDGLSATCEVLRLHCNEITAEGARHLAAVVPTCRVSVLDLSDNALSSAGAASIGVALAASRSMSQLYLRSNAIGDAGVRDIALALPSASRLTHLDLSDNRILDEGATYLASALALSPALENLCLACNQIGDQGAARIAVALAPGPATATGHKAAAGTAHADAAAASSSSSSAPRARAAPSCGALHGTLQILDVRANRVGAEGSRRLMEAAPAGCRIMLRF